MAAFSHYVDSQDAHIVEEVNNIHTKMIHWMVQALIRLAPDREDMSEEAKRIVYDSTSTVEVLEKIGATISEKLEKFSISLADRCNNIITEEENTRKANEESKYEKEFQNLQVFKSEVKEWNYVVKLLIAELNATESREKSNLEALTEDDYEETDQVFKEEMQEVEESENKHEIIENEEPQQNKPNTPEKTKENATNKEKSVKFEIISHDSNTEYKFLDSINLDDSN
ncbi:unnamed protein product, partial [Brachionus calyciflorus]